MGKPTYNGQANPSAAQVIEAKNAYTNELGVNNQVNGKQVMGYARAGDIYYLFLSDGTEVCRDNKGNPANWPL